MYWTIFYKNGIALTKAADRVSAQEWCEVQLGSEHGPFAIVPAVKEDLEDVGLALEMHQSRQDIGPGLSTTNTLDNRGNQGLGAWATLH